MNNKISRRKMLKQVAISLTIPGILLWFLGVKNKRKTAKKIKIVIPKNLTNGISFLDSVIIKKDESNIIAFSSKCTHLGCKINSTIDDKLVCPCHGSKFNFDGIPENGPATKQLTKLEIVKDEKTGEMVVYV